MNLTGGFQCGLSYPNDPSDPKEKLKNMNKERKKSNLPKPPNSCCLKHPNVSFSTGRVTENVEAGSGIWVFLTVPYVSSPLKVIFQIGSVVSEKNCVFSSTGKYINFQS